MNQKFTHYWFESLDRNVRGALQEAGERVVLPVSKCRFWEDHLTDRQRNELGDPEAAFKKHGGVIGVWRKFHGGSQPRAIIECAWRLGHLTADKREWLIDKIGETQQPDNDGGTTARIVWDRATGKLTMDGKLIRNVRVMRYNHLPEILDAFEVRGWPQSIPNPLAADQQTVHETVRTLNRGLQCLHFHAQDGGKFIYWEA